MHKNRTLKGLQLQAKHDTAYKKRLIGQKHNDGREIVNAEYIGNSVYGTVKVVFDNGTKMYITSEKFRPTNDDIESSGIILKK